MKKKTAILSFVLVIVFALLSAFLTFCSFRIPFTNYNWNSFANGMNFSGDISSGVSAKYSLTYTGDDVNAKNNLRKEIYNILDDYYTQPEVYLEGESTLFIDAGSEKNYADNERIENVLSLIGTKTAFRIYDYFGTCEDISISSVKSAYFQQAAGVNSLVVQLDKEGTEKLKSISATGFMYIKINSNDSPIANTSGDQITDGKIYVTGGNKASIVATLVNLQCEKTGVSLTYTETKSVTSSLADGILTVLLIAMLSIYLICVVLLTIKFRLLGLFTIFPASIFVGIYTLLLNILPNMQVNLGSLFAIILSLFISIFTSFSYLNENKKQFFDGKSLVNSEKFAFKKIIKNVLDFSFILIIPLIILVFVGSSALNNFAICLLVGLLVNMLVSLVVLRALTRGIIKIFENNSNLIGLSNELNKEAKDE